MEWISHQKEKKTQTKQQKQKKNKTEQPITHTHIPQPTFLCKTSFYLHSCLAA